MSQTTSSEKRWPAIVRLMLVLGVLGLIASVRLLREAPGRSVALAAGALLLSGLFAGKVARGVGLPRLTGYLLIGIAVGPYGLRFIPAEGVAGLELVKGLAVSLIALSAGTELRWGLLQRVGVKVTIMSAGLCLGVFLACWLALIAMMPFLPFSGALTWGQSVAVASLIAVVLVSFSPTVTIAILQETHAQGPFTEFLMATVIIGDLWVMILFALSAGITKAMFGGALGLGMLSAGIGWELFGSLAVGAALGFLTLLYLKRVKSERALFLCGLCFVIAEGGLRVHLSPLLIALAAAALIANVDDAEAERLNLNIERVGLPVFALFFAAAGAGLHLDAVRDVGLVAVVLVAVRMGAILLGTRFGPSEPPTVRKLLWMGLISQAGVTFGLASLMARTFPTFGPSAEVLLIAIITLHEMIGPILTRRALQKAGEVPLEQIGGRTLPAP
jgi:Kef-type K+ transport system membrane component KefB